MLKTNESTLTFSSDTVIKGRVVLPFESLPKDTLSLFEARKILGNNLWGPKIARERFRVKVKYDRKSAFPVPKYLCEPIAKTHRVIYVPPLSILRMRKIKSEMFPPCDPNESGWVSQEPFGRLPATPRWWIIPNRDAPVSSDDDNPFFVNGTPPNVAEVVYIILLWKELTGMWLLDRYAFDCLGKTTRGHEVCVGRLMKDSKLCLWPAQFPKVEH